MFRCVSLTFWAVAASGSAFAQSAAAPGYQMIASVEAAQPCPVAQQPWARRSVHIKVLSQDVRSVLKMISAEASVPITIDQNIWTPLVNVILQGSIPTVLDRLAEAAGIVWWWNGTEVRVVDRRDLQSRIWNVGDSAELQQLVRDIGIPDGAVQLQEAGGTGLVRVSGPRALLSELEPVIKTLMARSSQVRVTRYGRPSVEKAK